MYGQSTFRMTNGGPPPGGSRSLFRPSALSCVANNLIRQQEDELKEKETAQRTAEKHKREDDDEAQVSAKKAAIETTETDASAKSEDASARASQPSESEAATSSQKEPEKDEESERDADKDKDEKDKEKDEDEAKTKEPGKEKEETDSDTKPKQEADQEASSKSATEPKYNFVFGENVQDRVLLRTGERGKAAAVSSAQKATEESGNKKNDELQDGNNEEKTGSNDDSSKANDDPKSGIKAFETAKPCSSASLEPPRPQEELLTGEEGERNVLQVFGKLFAFNGTTKNWLERGRGYLRLNDVDQEKQTQLTAVHSTGALQKPVADDEENAAKAEATASDKTEEPSDQEKRPTTENAEQRPSEASETFVAPTCRIVMRRHGTQSVMLNSPVFAKMEVARVDNKRLRFTAQCVDESGSRAVRIFCLSAVPKDVQALHDALLLRRDRLTSNSASH